MGVEIAAMMAATSLAGAYAQAQAAQAQGDFQKKMSDLNAEIADRQAEDAEQRGGVEAGRAIIKGRRAADSARVAAAAAGLDPNSGSAADLIAESEAAGQMDAITIKNNAAREAWGYKVNAISSRSSGQMAQLAGSNEARNTMLAGGMRAAAYALDASDRYGKNKTTPKTTNKGTSVSHNDYDFYGNDRPNRYGDPGWSKRKRQI